MKYFGDPKFRKDHETQIDTPVGIACIHCEEPIVEGDTGTIDGSGHVLHYECVLRLVCGSVAHQLQLCMCCGGTQNDDPALTKRQAACAAAALWHATVWSI